MCAGLMSIALKRQCAIERASRAPCRNTAFRPLSCPVDFGPPNRTAKRPDGRVPPGLRNGFRSSRGEVWPGGSESAVHQGPSSRGTNVCRPTWPVVWRPNGIGGKWFWRGNGKVGSWIECVEGYASGPPALRRAVIASCWEVRCGNGNKNRNRRTKSNCLGQ